MTRKNHSTKKNRGDRRTFLRNTALLGLGAVGLSSGLGSAESNESSPLDTLPDEYQPGAPGVTVLTSEPDSRQTAKNAHIVLVLLIEEDDRLKTLVLGQGVEPVEYSVVANPENKTYKVTEFQYLEASQAETTTADSSASTKEQKHTDSSSDGSNIGIAATSYYGPFTVQITTHDFAEIRLCRTKQTLEWAYDNNLGATYITDRNWTAVWWAPTEAGTNWYKDWAKFVGRYEGSNECYTECEGQYYNDDFDDPNKRTFSWHKLHITGYSSGTTDYWGTADHWGEGSSYLHTHVKVV